jgi:NlpC/P60 family
MKLLVSAALGLFLGSASLSAQQNKNLIPPIVATVESSSIRGFSEYPPAIRKLLETSLSLTRKNLGYLYGADTPEERGMDCSGTVYYILHENGIEDVPRSSAEQYEWVKEKGTFTVTTSDDLDSPDFANLKPGDLLFWCGTYNTTAAASHAMIYLGKAQSDGLPLMVGASDGRTYRGKKCYGVSVFDFYLPKPESKSKFLGYARIPGLVGW